MAIYEYECQHCGEVIEVQQKITDEPLTTCTQPVEDIDGETGNSCTVPCGGTLVKLISKSSFSLKGNWFKQGY